MPVSNRADNLAGLIKDLRSSMTTFSKTSQATFQVETSTPTISFPPDDQAFFTDRRYHPERDRYRGRFNQEKSYNRRKRNKCFVCEKKGCWSTKHSKEDQDKAKARYKERLGQRFDRRASHYISSYEGTEDQDSDEDSLNDQIETLMIDVPVPTERNATDSQAFFTSFGQIEYPEKMMTDLANRSFSHTLGLGPEMNFSRKSSTPEPANSFIFESDPLPI
jgi:hypothetical protein